MITQSQKVYEKFIRQVRSEGREEGLRDAILDVCAARTLVLTEAQRATLAAQTDAAALRRWLTRAVTAGSADELFGHTG